MRSCVTAVALGVHPLPAGTIASWVKEMAAHVKSLDSNHMLTVSGSGCPARHCSMRQGLAAFGWLGGTEAGQGHPGHPMKGMPPLAQQPFLLMLTNLYLQVGEEGFYSTTQ